MRPAPPPQVPRVRAAAALQPAGPRQPLLLPPRRAGHRLPLPRPPESQERRCAGVGAPAREGVRGARRTLLARSCHVLQAPAAVPWRRPEPSQPLGSAALLGLPAPRWPCALPRWAGGRPVRVGCDAHLGVGGEASSLVLRVFAQTGRRPGGGRRTSARLRREGHPPASVSGSVLPRRLHTPRLPRFCSMRVLRGSGQSVQAARSVTVVVGSAGLTAVTSVLWKLL